MCCLVLTLLLRLLLLLLLLLRACSHNPRMHMLLICALCFLLSPSKQPAVAVFMELMERGELFDFLKHTGGLPEMVARHFCIKLLQGLHTCHQAGVFHRDIKLDNILLDIHYNIKLADFGLACRRDPAAAPAPIVERVGTESFMAPEVFAGHSYLPEQADVWSLGVVLFILHAGFPPITKPQAGCWYMDRLLHQQYSHFWDAHARVMAFSPDFMNLMEGMLKVNPAQRLTLAQIAEHPWVQGRVPSAAGVTADMTRRWAIVERRVQEARAQAADHVVRAGEAAIAGVTRGAGEAELPEPTRLTFAAAAEACRGGETLPVVCEEGSVGVIALLKELLAEACVVPAGEPAARGLTLTGVLDGSALAVQVIDIEDGKPGEFLLGVRAADDATASKLGAGQPHRLQLLHAAQQISQKLLGDDEAASAMPAPKLMLAPPAPSPSIMAAVSAAT